VTLIVAFLAGLAFGAVRARNRGGGAADMVQYGLAHGFMAFAVVAGVLVILGLAGVSSK